MDNNSNSSTPVNISSSNNATNSTPSNTNTLTTANTTNNIASQLASGNSSSSSSMISIKVRIVDSNIIKTLQFNPSTLVYDALKIIKEKIPETNTENGNLITKLGFFFYFFYKIFFYLF